MTWVKVCGLTNADDVEQAVAAGADALGFVLAERSPRRLTVEEASALMADVPVTRILVTEDAGTEFAIEAARETGADGVQPHGTQRADVARAVFAAGLFTLYPMPVTDSPPDLSTVPDGHVPLFDSAHPDLGGGTGRPFDWSIIAGLSRRFVLAGGLGPDNVGAAVAAARPWGVDASSRLERAPGRKNHGKVAAFIREAKAQWY